MEWFLVNCRILFLTLKMLSCFLMCSATPRNTTLEKFYLFLTHLSHQHYLSIIFSLKTSIISIYTLENKLLYATACNVTTKYTLAQLFSCEN